jgi:hypothetical protein
MAGGQLYDMACVCSLASSAAKGDPLLAERYAALAVVLLRKAKDAAYFREPSKVADMKADTDIEPLRGRADYQTFLGELEPAKAGGQ